MQSVFSLSSRAATSCPSINSTPRRPAKNALHSAVGFRGVSPVLPVASRTARGQPAAGPSCGRMRAGSGSLDTNSGAAGGCGQTPAPEAPPAIGERKTLAGKAFPPFPSERREADRVFRGCGRQEASTRLQPVRHLWLPAARRPACRRVPAMPLDGDRGRAGRPLDGGLARQPALYIKSRNGTAQDRRRRRTIERPIEAATGSSRRIVNRVRRDPAGSPVMERVV